MKKYIGLAIAVVLVLNTEAQTFSGKITYEMSYEQKGEESLGMMTMMLPKTETLYIKGNRAKIIQESSMGKNIFIKDLDQDTTLVFIEIMGQKIQMLLSQDQIENQYNFFKAQKIEYASGKKMIDKQVCKRALVTYDDSLAASEVYYIPDVVNSAYPMFGDLKGLPLTFSIDEDIFMFTKTAISVEKMDVSDQEFNPLEGYTQKTPEELKALFQGFGGN